MSDALEQLRHELDDVVRDRAMAVRYDAAAAWTEGRRRRVRARAAAVAVVAAVVGGAVALTPVLATLPPIAPASNDRATEHPVRLDYTYWNGGQPTVNGPLAGLVSRGSTWETVSPSGQLGELHVSLEDVPALSPDGSHVGYMRGPFRSAFYVIEDQTTGKSVEFPEIGTGAVVPQPSARYFHSGQQPAFWAPGGTQIVLRIGLSNVDDPGPDPAVAVLGTDGSMRLVPDPPGARGGANPVGWIDDDHIALAGKPTKKADSATVWVVDVGTGQVSRSFTLTQGIGSDLFLDQWFGNLSPDGRLLATQAGEGPDIRVRLYSTTGADAGTLVRSVSSSASGSCSPSWSSSGLYLPTLQHDGGDASILRRADGTAAIAADPRLGIDCSTWARSALDGPAHQSLSSRLFGQQDTWLSWHWRELTSGLLLLLALGLGIRLLARRSGRRLAR